VDFIDEVEDDFVITVRVTSDLSGRLRSNLLDDVEYFFESESVLAENRVCEFFEVRFAVFASILLSVFSVLPRLTTPSLPQ
jgi:hypothetical protein